MRRVRKQSVLAGLVAVVGLAAAGCGGDQPAATLPSDRALKGRVPDRSGKGGDPKAAARGATPGDR